LTVGTRPLDRRSAAMVTSPSLAPAT
jgi:hypothetical protein